MRRKLQELPNRPDSCSPFVHSLRRIFRSDSGQSLIELALLTPLLLSMIIGIVEMGRYASMSLTIGNAARAGAAFGAQSTTDAGDPGGPGPNGLIEKAALDDLTDLPGGLTCPAGSGASCVTPTFVCGCDTGGTVIPTTETNAACAVTCNVGSHLVVSVQVTVTGKFNSLFTWPGIPASLTITKTATERVSQ